MQENELELTYNKMLQKGFSKRTIQAYLYWIRRYSSSGMNLRAYCLHLLRQGNAPETVRLASAAIRFHHHQKAFDIPKRKKVLPGVLSKKEILSMIDGTKNLKHRLLLMLLYSTGMRVSEALHLKWEHIKENHILIKSGKGNKDRITLLSKKLKRMLKEFEQPEGYVLQGRNGRYSYRSAQQVISLAAKRAGVMGRVTPHMLRHSFATHLLEQGTGICYIQQLLGHSGLETTQIFTPVSRADMQHITNPLD